MAAVADKKKEAKEAAINLLKKAEEEGVLIKGSEQNKIVVCGKTLLENKFDTDAALKDLIGKYGQEGGKAKKEEEEEEEDKKPKEKPKKKGGAKKKATRSVKDEDEEEAEDEEKPKKKRGRPKKEAAAKKEGKEGEAGEDGEEETPSKKKNKAKVAVHSENEGIAKMLREISAYYFKEKDGRKGATYAKAYTALMESPEIITSGKEAKKLKGIGDSLAGKIDEYLEKGTCDLLEELKNNEHNIM